MNASLIPFQLTPRWYTQVYIILFLTESLFDNLQAASGQNSILEGLIYVPYASR